MEIQFLVSPGPTLVPELCYPSLCFPGVLFTQFYHSHYPVTACLVPMCSLYGVAVTTVEGIGSIKTRIHPVQVRVYSDWDQVLV